MESVLFVPSVRATAWVGEVLPGTSPAELPVAGRRIVDYSLEIAHACGFLFAEVLDWQFSEQLANDFSELTRTGYPVFYMKGEGPMPTGLRDLEGYSSPLTGAMADGLVVVWGLAISMHTADEVTLEPVSDEDCAATPAGLYRREGGRWLRMVPHGLVVRSAKAWHELNFIVLRHPNDFTIPGYSSERHVNIGRNAVIEHGTEVKPPVLLQDNTWLARNVRLEGEVIVDSGSYISEGARLRRTVVCRDTFIGPGLDLDGKIAVGRRIIDAATGTWVDLEEPGLARRIPAGLGWARSLWHFLRGRSYGRRG